MPRNIHRLYVVVLNHEFKKYRTLFLTMSHNNAFLIMQKNLLKSYLVGAHKYTFLQQQEDHHF